MAITALYRPGGIRQTWTAKEKLGLSTEVLIILMLPPFESYDQLTVRALTLRRSELVSVDKPNSCLSISRRRSTSFCQNYFQPWAAVSALFVTFFVIVLVIA